MRTQVISLLVAIMAVLAFPSIAGAHAVVYPKQANANSYEKFMLRVPNEKSSATIRVKVEMPEGWAISRVKPVPGWSYTFEKSADGKTVKAITWSGGKILDGEFQEFEFNGKTANNPGTYAFRAWQTYEDGETVEWTGAADAPKPASFVQLVASAAQTDAHGHTNTEPKPGTAPAPATPAPGANQPAAPVAAEPTAANPLNTAAAWGGLVLGAGALLVALRRK